MSQFSPFILIGFLILLFLFSKAFRKFSLRGILGVVALFIVSVLNVGVSFNYLGIAVSTLLGIPGAFSFVALSYIL